MPIEIREIVTEVVVRGPDASSAGAAGSMTPASDEELEARTDALVRQAVERVLDILRHEWEP